MTKDNILHLGNRSVRPNLGDRNCRIFVVVLASKTVQGISIVSAFLGTNPGGAGGSGVVILRVLTSNYSGTTTGSPTVTTDGSYKVIKFTGSGSYTA